MSHLLIRSTTLKIHLFRQTIKQGKQHPLRKLLITNNRVVQMGEDLRLETLIYSLHHRNSKWHLPRRLFIPVIKFKIWLNIPLKRKKRQWPQFKMNLGAHSSIWVQEAGVVHVSEHQQEGLVKRKVLCFLKDEWIRQRNVNLSFSALYSRIHVNS